MIMNSFKIKVKKIFITFLFITIIMGCFSQAFAAAFTSKLKAGDKLRFEGTKWFVYKSSLAALTNSSSGIVDYLEENEVITIKSRSRKYY